MFCFVEGVTSGPLEGVCVFQEQVVFSGKLCSSHVVCAERTQHFVIRVVLRFYFRSTPLEGSVCYSRKLRSRVVMLRGRSPIYTTRGCVCVDLRFHFLSTLAGGVPVLFQEVDDLVELAVPRLFVRPARFGHLGAHLPLLVEDALPTLRALLAACRTKRFNYRS